MKQHFAYQSTTVLLTIALLLVTANCQAQNLSHQGPVGIPPQLNGAHINDALIEMGRTSNVNFIADATHFPPEATPIGSDPTLPVEQQLVNFSAEHKLTWLLKGQTLLIWSEPDVGQLAQRIISGDTIKLITINPPQGAESSVFGSAVQRLSDNNRLAPKALLTEELLSKEAFTYFRDKRAWNGQTPGVVSEVKVSELPPDLRVRIVAKVQATALRPVDVTIMKAWFNDDFWNNARLQLIEQPTGNPNGETVQVITVGASFRIGSGTGGTMMSLGALEGKPNN